MRPKRLSVLGVGLLGGSIGLAVKSVIRDCRVVGYGHRKATLEASLGRGAIDEAHEQAEAAVKGADLVILCTPVGIFEPILRRISPVLAPGCIVTDVGSTKRAVVEAAELILPASVHFVGSHPMAGSEKRGVEYASGDLFRDAHCLMTPTEKTDLEALASVEAFWGILGMRTSRLSPEEHDRRLADVSHLPHAVAAALVAMQEEESLGLTGKGFLDATRIAGGDGALWRDIFLQNRDNLLLGMDQLFVQLQQLRQLLEKKDGEAIRKWLDEAAKRRDDMAAGGRGGGAA